MTIDRLSALSAHIAALRADVSRKSGGARDRREADDADGVDVAPDSRARDIDSLRKRLADLVRDIDPNDVGALKNARERVVKAVLLWEFGQDLRENAEWRPMVETIAESLVADERLRGAFDRLIKELRA